MKTEGFKELRETVLKSTQMKGPIAFHCHHIPLYTGFPHGNDSRITAMENNQHFCHYNLFDI